MIEQLLKTGAYYAEEPIMTENPLIPAEMEKQLISTPEETTALPKHKSSPAAEKAPRVISIAK